MYIYFKKWMARYLPFLGAYKRYLKAAVMSAMPVKKSYSQYGEDSFIIELVKKHRTEGSLYVDVGANHPTDISNTYILYRNGFRGVVIEPNYELLRLFQTFRKRDTAVGVGCSNENAVLEFNISATPVISSFKYKENIRSIRQSYVPVMPLDTVLRNINLSYVNFLSVDVEGLNIDVLKGAVNTLRQTLILCVEFDLEEEKLVQEQILGTDFKLLREFGCNRVYINEKLSAKYLIGNSTIV